MNFDLDIQLLRDDAAYREELRQRVAEEQPFKDWLRLRCQTELLLLGYVLGYGKLLERVHGPVEELCVRKNPALPIEMQDRIKDRLHLDPRGTFKSTLSIVDSVQWIICFPNVRICKLTATKPLATAIAGEIAGHFVKAPIADATLFQELFPEFCIKPGDKEVGKFTAPNRTREWREATVMAFSNETSISGWHFDVLDPDDVVDTVNSKTPGSIANVKKNYRINRKTLMPWGYTNFKGTRYNPFDLWGDIISKAKPGKIKLLIRSALKMKNGRRLEEGVFPAPDEIELLFPELLDYDYLKKEFDDDYESFMTQYMNDAHGGKQVTFPKELLLERTIPVEQVPISGEISIAWRFSCESKPSMQHSAGAVGQLHNGRMVIIDMQRGMFKPSDLAANVVELNKRHGSHRVQIEDTPGARYVEAAIKNYALILNWGLDICWTEHQEDDGARTQRMKGAEPLLVAGRLLFSEGIRAITEAFRQFENFGMIDENEIPDVVERVSQSLPKSLASESTTQEQDLAWELARQRDLYDRVNGLGVYAPREPQVEEKPYSPPANDYGLTDVIPGLNA